MKKKNLGDFRYWSYRQIFIVFFKCFSFGLLFSFFWLHCEAWRILVSQPGTGASQVKIPLENAGDWRDVGLNPGSGTPGVGNGNPLQYSEESGGLQSIGSHRVRHDWSDLAHSTQPGIESLPSAIEAQSPNHWTAREVAQYLSFSVTYFT